MAQFKPPEGFQVNQKTKAQGWDGFDPSKLELGTGMNGSNTDKDGSLYAMTAGRAQPANAGDNSWYEVTMTAEHPILKRTDHLKSWMKDQGGQFAKALVAIEASEAWKTWRLFSRHRGPLIRSRYAASSDNAAQGMDLNLTVVVGEDYYPLIYSKLESFLMHHRDIEKFQVEYFPRMAIDGKAGNFYVVFANEKGKRCYQNAQLCLGMTVPRYFSKDALIRLFQTPTTNAGMDSSKAVAAVDALQYRDFAISCGPHTHHGAERGSLRITVKPGAADSWHVHLWDVTNTKGSNTPKNKAFVWASTVKNDTGGEKQLKLGARITFGRKGEDHSLKTLLEMAGK